MTLHEFVSEMISALAEFKDAQQTLGVCDCESVSHRVWLKRLTKWSKLSPGIKKLCKDCKSALTSEQS